MSVMCNSYIINDIVLLLYIILCINITPQCIILTSNVRRYLVTIIIISILLPLSGLSGFMGTTVMYLGILKAHSNMKLFTCRVVCSARNKSCVYTCKRDCIQLCRFVFNEEHKSASTKLRSVSAPPEHRSVLWYDLCNPAWASSVASIHHQRLLQ